jgi:hypothetical protein
MPRERKTAGSTQQAEKDRNKNTTFCGMYKRDEKGKKRKEKKKVEWVIRSLAGGGDIIHRREEKEQSTSLYSTSTSLHSEAMSNYKGGSCRVPQL